MSKSDFSDLSFPTSSRVVFDKMLWTDWYDGITAGLVLRSRIAKAFKLDILAWDSSQKRRVFVLSPFDLPTFDRIVALLAEDTVPTWPKWDPAWPPRAPENEQLITEIEQLLRSQANPEYVLASEASFETIFGLRKLEEPARNLVPQEFKGVPFRDNLDYWEEYVKNP